MSPSSLSPFSGASLLAVAIVVLLSSRGNTPLLPCWETRSPSVNSLRLLAGR